MLKIPDIEELFKVGAHFGHTKERTHPKNNKNIYKILNKIAIIDLDKSIVQLKTALDFIKTQASEGKTFLMVGSKRQTSSIVERIGKELDIPFVANKWLGGTITNFSTIKSSLKKIKELDNEIASEEFSQMSKRHQSLISKKAQKMHDVLDGIKNLDKIPDVLIAIDTVNESIAVKEAIKYHIPVVGVADTNANPELIDYPIMLNDDSTKAMELIIGLIAQTIKEGRQNIKLRKQNDN